jgi:hypothetical protein
LSDISNSSTEDEAGLNTRDQDEAEASFSQRRHNFLHYNMDHFHPNSNSTGGTSSAIASSTILNETGRRFSRSNAEVQDLSRSRSPPNRSGFGLDLRLNSPLESWREYVRATSHPSDQINNMDGYWSSANDWNQ